MQGNKGFVAGVLMLAALILSLVSFCLLQKLMSATNNITERKNEQSDCSNLNPYVLKHFSAPKQELGKHEIKMTFNWGRPNPWPIPKLRNNNQHQSNQVGENK